MAYQGHTTEAGYIKACHSRMSQGHLYDLVPRDAGPFDYEIIDRDLDRPLGRCAYRFGALWILPIGSPDWLHCGGESVAAACHKLRDILNSKKENDS